MKTIKAVWKKIKDFFSDLIYRVKAYYKYKKKMKEIKKRDPFIYK